jgi:hypothetical protein
MRRRVTAEDSMQAALRVLGARGGLSRAEVYSAMTARRAWTWSDVNSALQSLQDIGRVHCVFGRFYTTPSAARAALESRFAELSA